MNDLVKLSEAYLRLRAMIPGAFRTPHAPTPEQVWEQTEKALSYMVERLHRYEAQVESIERAHNIAIQEMSKAIHDRG